MFIEEEDTTDEPVIINDDEEGLFVDDLIEQPYILRKNLFKLKPITKKIDDCKMNYSLIKLGREDLVTLLSFFEPTYDNFDKCIKYVFKSPYKQEFIVGWYCQGEYNYASTIRNFSQEYYTPEKSNNWFFIIVNELHPKQRNYILEKYFKLI